MSSLLLNLLFPPRCAGCDGLIPIRDWRRGDECLCRACRAAWEMAKLEHCPQCHEPMLDCRCMTYLLEESGMQTLRKLMWYGMPDSKQRTVGDRLLYRVKDGHVIAYEKFLADQLSHGVLSEMKYRGWLMTDEQGNLPFETVVTYCPRSPRKVREKGTDQAERMARHLASRLGLPFVPMLARRDNAEQKTLDREERRRHASHSYHLRRGASVALKRVILVDDIVTTGASMAACTEVLLDGGALSVIGVAVAQTRRKKEKKEKKA